MNKFVDIIFTKDACCGDHAEIEFINGYIATVTKCVDLYTVLAKKDGLLASNFDIQRNVDEVGVETALDLIEKL
jgi:hypothetical protein